MTSPSQTTVTTRRYIFDRIGSFAKHLQQQSTAPLAPLPQFNESAAILANINGLSLATGCTHPAVALRWLARHHEPLRSVSCILPTKPTPDQPLPDATTERLTRAARRSCLISPARSPRSSTSTLGRTLRLQRKPACGREFGSMRVPQGLPSSASKPSRPPAARRPGCTCGSTSDATRCALCPKRFPRTESHGRTACEVCWMRPSEHVLLDSLGFQAGDVLASTISVMDRAREVGAPTGVLRTAEDVSSRRRHLTPRAGCT